MIKDNLGALILSAMKSGEKVRLKALRAIKTAFMEWETAKVNIGKQLNEQTEFSIIKKLIASYEDTAIQCNDGKHEDLVNESKEIAQILSEFIPQAASEDEITNTFIEITKDIEPIKKNMGTFVKRIKEILPNADGKTVSQIVMKKLT
jgi:uncharacterized protein YqeY